MHGGPFTPVTLAVQQNPTAVPFVSPLLPSAGGPLYVPAAGFFNARPALLSSGTDAGLYTTRDDPQPCSWWCVVSFGGNGWSFDSSVAYTGLRVDAGVAWVINSNAFSFGVMSDWSPMLGFADSYLVCITFDGAATTLHVGTTLRVLAPGLVDMPNLFECIFGPFPGSGAIDSAWAAGGFVPGGISMPDLASLHTWKLGEYLGS